MKLSFSKESKKPKQLGLTQVRVKSLGKTVYLPRFKIDGQELIVEFGHYYGFGAYCFSSLMEDSDYGLNLYGGDKSFESSIDWDEMKKFRAWVVKNRAKLVKKLKSEF